MKEIEIQLKNFEDSIKKLKDALNYDPSTIDIAIDATIQRFEFTFENAWKSIMLMAKYIGLGECKSPRGCIKLGYKLEWIKDEETWLSLLQSRNLTSHTYNKDMAYRVYEEIKKNYYLFDELLKCLKEWRE